MTAPGPDRPPRRTGALLLSLLHPRTRRVDVAVAVLLGVLGFGLVVQVRSNAGDGLLVRARQEDLVQILDELSQRNDRLQQEAQTLSATRARLASGGGATSAALSEARRRGAVLAILAGTAPAAGTGVQVRIADPQAKVSASLLLDTLEELRNAGAEAVQLEGTGPTASVTAVRIVAGSSFTDDARGVAVDGTPLTPPYRFTALGDSSALAGAMAIPGGVEDAVRQAGGQTQVTRSQELHVGALHVLRTPRYARTVPAGPAP